MQYQKLFRLLEKRGLAPSDLVRYDIISAATYMRLRNNQTVSMYTLELLCRVLNCKLSDIVTTDPDPEDEEIPSYDIY